MIRLIQIISDSNIGGAGRCLINYLRYRDRSRFAVTVILPTGSRLIPQVLALGAEVIEVDGIAERSFSPGAVVELTRILRRERPDIVHTHGSFSGRIAGRLAGARLVYTRHSAFPVSARLQKGPLHHLNGWINGCFADAIIAVSPAAEETLIQSGISPKLITLIGNGVSPLTSPDSSQQQLLRQQWQVPEQVFTAGYPARLEAYKGHDLIFDAAQTLRSEGRDFRILIAGTGTYEADLRCRAEEMGLSGYVRFLGFVENMPGLLSILDVQLNCSTQSEACSLSILEGMSMGLPTIASRCSGNPWLVEDGVTGILFENGNAGALADALRRLMDDPDSVEAMGKAAHTAYCSRFTGSIFAKNLERLYDGLLK